MFSLAAKMRRNKGTVVTGVSVSIIALKSLELTVNDDWDTFKYSLDKRIKNKDYGLFVDSSIKKNEEKTLPKVVILGTGWGSLSFLQSLDQQEMDITIISPRSYFFYTPLLAGTAVGTVR